MIRQQVAFTLVFAFGLSSTCSAAVALSDLMANNDSIVSGDLVFDQFTFSGFGNISDATEIIVSGEDLLMSPGIRFQGGFADVSGDGPSGFTITYVVSVLSGDNIVSSLLQGNPAAILSGMGSFTSTFAEQSLMIFDNAETGETDLLDSTPLNNPVSQLEIQLDFLAEAGPNGLVTGSFVDQSFSVVPEISSLGTWLTLMMGVAGFCVVTHLRTPATEKVKSPS